jgi:ring-1,2-phenylacetyl-CoA epoxidase subunit PaaE
MTPKFHTLKISDIRQETDDCVSVAFAVPQELNKDYQFIQGQYLTLKTQINAEEVRRSYSICASPLDNELRVAIKRVKEGLFSNYANDNFKIGDSIDVMTPMGKFYTELKEDNAKNYLAFAGGSGITPMLSIMKTVLLTEPNSRFTLLYGNQNRNTIIFKELIEGIKNQFMQRLRVYHILSNEITDVPLLSGLMTKEKCGEFFQKLIDLSNIDECFICGPEPMMDSVEAALQDAKMDTQKVHIERFTPSTNLKPKTEKVETADAEMVSSVSVQLDGVVFDLKVKYGGESILDAALKAGADLPFACKGGVCCTCRAKVIEGEVHMDVNYALEKDEVAQGFVLTCQSHPKTEKVFIDFDVR